MVWSLARYLSPTEALLNTESFAIERLFKTWILEDERHAPASQAYGVTHKKEQQVYHLRIKLDITDTMVK